MTVRRGAPLALVVSFVAGVALLAGALAPRLFRGGVAPAAAVSAVDVLSGPSAGFARASEPRRFSFPEDHGSHPRFRWEWWYYTGNLAATTGRRFGYQLTFFRIGLTAEAAPRASAWATDAAWMAHFAVTDVTNGKFIASSRFARGALGLAGATAQPFRVWLEDWSARGLTPDAAHPPMQLVAGDRDVAIELTLATRKPPVLQGDRGLSRKGPGEGNASYYYSLTRLATDGHVRIGNARIAVSGSSWMDREWSTSALEGNQVGWDWFALALDDGRELMVYRLRRADGTVDPFSAGTLVTPDGTALRLAPADVTVQVLEQWTSPRGSARYPSRWRLALPAHALTLDVTPRVADQEWTEPVRYWEGAVEARGTSGSRAITGDGYVELVGYGPSADR